MTQRELIDYIVATHHRFTREALAKLRTQFQTVIPAHGTTHPELIAVCNIFDRLFNDLMPHMMREENILFPYIAELEQASQQGGLPYAPPFNTVRNPVRRMTLEHDAAGALLNQLRRLTSDYTAPTESCVCYASLYTGLADLERDLREHIHHENDILFPRAVRQEADLAGSYVRL